MRTRSLKWKLLPNLVFVFKRYCQVKLLQEEIRHKKSDIRVLKKEFSSSQSSIQHEISECYEGMKLLKWNLDFTSKIDGRCSERNTQKKKKTLVLRQQLSHLMNLCHWNSYIIWAIWQPSCRGNLSIIENVGVIESWVECRMFKATQTKLFALQNFHWIIHNWFGVEILKSCFVSPLIPF